MLCYKDRQWCSQACANLECYRNLTPAEQKSADSWWATWKSLGPTPIDMRDMKGTVGCENAGGYMEPANV